MNRRRLPGITAALLALALAAGCGGAPSTRDGTGAYRANGVVADRAASYAQKFIGTRYRYGGNRPDKGFDCSGLVQYSYSLAGLQVPRSTERQMQATRYVPTNRLKPGDLLFFHQQGKRFSHVGLYIGRGRFVHAPSTGKSVKISTLSNSYWRKHLASTRRFIY